MGENMKKIFISADLEGITGVTDWCETRYGGQGYAEACRQMSLETAAACRAALGAGYQVVVKDGHEDARNIDPHLLPRGVALIRGWMISPMGMLGGLDESYDGVIYIGYHARAASDASPLNHTTEDYLFHQISVNGTPASEFSFNSMLADELGVPSLFLSGDRGICEEARREYPGIHTFSVKSGIGNSTWNIHPEEAAEEIEKAVSTALMNQAALRPMQVSYKMEITFKQHQRARRASWYPGAEMEDGYTVIYTAKTPMELAIAKMFMTEGA